MSYRDPALPLQKATLAWLNNHSTGPKVSGRIYDGVPSNPVKPYISFGPFQMLPEHGDCLNGGEVFMTLDAWAAGPSTVQVKDIGAAIAADLDEAPIVLDGGQRLVDISIEQTQYLRDPDGLTAHAVITVHAWTEPTT
jgi:uncharacterized protein DUF3168